MGFPDCNIKRRPLQICDAEAMPAKHQPKEKLRGSQSSPNEIHSTAIRADSPVRSDKHTIPKNLPHGGTRRFDTQALSIHFQRRQTGSPNATIYSRMACAKET